MSINVYFASPWFNPEQAEREERVKAKLKSIGLNIFSPKDNIDCPPDASEAMRDAAFNGNVEHIQSADVVFAITDTKDMGTIWEAGMAYGINRERALTNGKQIKIVYYCETLGNGQFNLMLAKSGDIVITNFDELDNLVEMIERGTTKKYVGQIQ